MNRCIVSVLLAALLCVGGVGTARADDGYGMNDWGDDIKASSWESGGAFVAVTALGLTSWEWGSSKSFRWNPEGWFGMDTGSGGMDKLGHAYTSYAITNVVADRLMKEGRPPWRAALSSALTTQAIMLYVECFDGFSDDHGFAWEDLVMNLSGTALGAARALDPKFRSLVDYRMEYIPSGYKGFRPFSDYSGQKYLLAFKLGGLDGLRNSPARFLELHAGYYTRGFSKDELRDGKQPKRYAMAGIGLDLSELLFGSRSQNEMSGRHYGRLLLEHVQVPYTAVHGDKEL
jgi:hypothetical protein